jgi:hypothetical protein
LSRRQTCSGVTSGFFPPEPFSGFGDNSQDDETEGEKPDQAAITPSFEVHQSRFLLGESEEMFDGRAAEGGSFASGERRSLLTKDFTSEVDS